MLGDFGWRRRQLDAESVEMRLPDAMSWVPEPHVGSWSVIRHPPSESLIYVRHRAAQRTVTPEECRSTARYSLLPLRGDREELVKRRQDVPGYYGVMRVELLRSGRPVVTWFAAGLSRCLELVFVPGPAAPIPEVLSLITDGTLPTVRVVELSQRAPQAVEY